MNRFASIPWRRPPNLVATLLFLFLGACGGGHDAPASDAAAAPPSSAADQRGQLVGATPLGQVTAAEVVGAIQAAGSIFPAVTPLYDVTTWRLTYFTVDAQGAPIVASGLVAVPNKATGATSPVASYQHPTTLTDAEAPTNSATADAPPVFVASLGYLVVAPDYVGYGASKGAPHPYLIAAPTAAAVVDLLAAAASWRQANGVADNGQLFLIGYSEGGYASVAAHRALQASGGSLFASLVADVPGSGPYDVKVTLDQLLDEVRQQQPILGALINPGLLRFLGDSVREQIRNELLKLLLPANTDIVLDPTIFDEFLADDATGIEQGSNVDGWAPTGPVRLFAGPEDQTVPYPVATTTLQTMQSLGASDVTLTNCTAVPSSHLGCAGPYLAFLLGQLAASARDL